jgi:hypothetical protein
LSKINKINITFQECFNILNESSRHIFDYDEEDYDIILNIDNYDAKIKNIIKNYSNFVSFFQNFTEGKFITANVSNNFSEYDYNIVKLRTGIFYTKGLSGTIENIFEELNYSSIINIDKINKYDKILNDKNIFNINIEANNKLRQIYKESIQFIEEPFQYFMEDFTNKYSYKNDYLPFLNEFKKIISLNNEDYNDNMTYIINEKLDNIFSLLNEFNKTLYEQLSFIRKYSYYNFNETNFRKTFSNYYDLLLNAFNSYENTIYSLNNSYVFHNSIKNIIDDMQKKKEIILRKL